MPAGMELPLGVRDRAASAVRGESALKALLPGSVDDEAALLLPMDA